jgi:DNA modification methylase
MHWIKYICPPRGVVLDPFMGSGTTGEACRLLNREFIGIERYRKYYDLAKDRLVA